jgi:2-C-methyl-D-erythritol 2,4-cyclodiphosphate synthase
MLSLPENSVGLTATTGEGLTAFGRGEGMQAFAVVSAVRKN